MASEVPPADVPVSFSPVPVHEGPSEDPVAADAIEDELLAETEPTKTEERSGLRKLLSSAMGTDLTSMAVPVTYNEPLSFLQRMCEYLQYHDLLQKVLLLPHCPSFRPSLVQPARTYTPYAPFYRFIRYRLVVSQLLCTSTDLCQQFPEFDPANALIWVN